MTRSSRRRSAFTLVELLVVIGVIALLISILLPSLNRARQFASSIKCASNQRQIGMLFFMYSAQNKGFLPRSSYTTPGWTSPGANPQANNPDANPKAQNAKTSFWGDQLSIISDRRYLQAKMGNTGTGAAGTLYANYNFANADNMALDFVPIFHDTDLPAQSIQPRVSTYFVNPRVIAPMNARDRAVSTDGSVGGGLYAFVPQRTQASIKNASNAMMMWCGPVRVDTDGSLMINQYDAAAWNIDAFALGNGHYLCNPMPSHSPYFANQVCYDNKIGITSDGGTYGSSYGSPVTQTALKAGNVDWNGTINNAMRFRHMSNSSANFLFVDGHVESRELGGVLARDICVNPAGR